MMKMKVLIISLICFLSACHDNEPLALLIKDMSPLVEFEVPVAASLNDPCLLANGRAAADWYQRLPTQYRETLKQNVQRYVRAIRFVKTEIVSGVPVSLARTSVSYDRGTVVIATRGVLDEQKRVVCHPDIDAMVEMTVAQSLAMARN
jgi:hypothetical protein